ncbi:MAG: sulfatase [Planctomycetota bacterium]|jgi:arylsulfatase A-like enzyme
MTSDRLVRILVLLVLPLATACSEQGERRPNILLVTWDTTRVDHLSCYGYERPTSPRLDELAADGMRYTNAYAVASWTLPTHASLFTGKLPSSHGAKFDEDGPLKLTQGIEGMEEWDAYAARPLGENEITLATLLGAHGYATGAVVGGPWMRKVFGLDRGFTLYDDSNYEMRPKIGEINGRRADDLTDAAIEFVDANRERPFFLFLNYFDPHRPRMPLPAYRNLFWEGAEPGQDEDRRDYELAMYDAEIVYTDEHFGRLIEHLKELGLYEDTWIVVTADHGELLGDDGLWGHGDSLSQAEIHVPLIVKEPGARPPRGVDGRPVQQIDVMPTLIERLGLPSPPNMQGQPMARVDHPVIAESDPLAFMTEANSDWRQQGAWRVLIEGEWKFCWNSLGKHALYDLGADPDELQNLFALRPDVAERMETRLHELMASLPPPGELGDVGAMDEATLRFLEETGYVGGDR